MRIHRLLPFAAALLSGRLFAVTVAPEALVQAIVDAPLVAIVEVTRLTVTESPSITTLAESHVLEIQKSTLPEVTEGSTLIIEIPGGNTLRGFLAYSGLTYPTERTRYTAILAPTDHFTFRVVGFDQGMKPLSASRHSIRNQVGCPGSNPAYVHWDTRFMPIPYFISIDSFRSHPDLLDGIRPSFEAWRNIDSLGVDFLPMGCTRSRTNENDGVNSIILVTDHWDFAPEAIAVTRNFFVGCESSYAGQILDSDILLNGVDHTFSLGPSTSAHDVQNILTHEIGHFLGLGHETSDGDPESTMWASADFFETKKRTPKETDSQGVRANYPMVIPKSAPYEGMDCSPTSTATFACSAVGPQSRAGVDLGPLMALLIPLSVWVRKSRTAKSDTTPTATISGAIPF